MMRRIGLLPGGKIVAGFVALVCGVLVATLLVSGDPTPSDVTTVAPPSARNLESVTEASEGLGRSLNEPEVIGSAADEPTELDDIDSAPAAIAMAVDPTEEAEDAEPTGTRPEADTAAAESTTPTTSATTPATSATAAPATTSSPRPATPTTAAPTESTAAPTTTRARTSRPAPSSTSTPSTTTSSTTTTVAPAPARRTASAGVPHLASSAPTKIPVYDTAWQMLVRGTPNQTDEYFATLKQYGFSGTWAGVIHHAPATWNANFTGGGRVGNMVDGEVVLTPEYIAHVRAILDTAQRHGMQVGLVAAWQNLYLPGGGADAGIPTSNQVRGSITTANAYAYGRHIARAFGDHPAVGMWVFGGDAGTNNTEANKAVWREMARGVRDTGNRLDITYHTPTSEFDQLNYAGESWLDFIAPETGHAQDANTTEAELRAVGAAYRLPVWQGEPRYFNINFDWVNAAFRNPGVAEVRADAQAAANAGVAGYVYGDAGRWTWCAGYGDSTPCNANNIARSFGDGERAVIRVFS